MSGIFISTQQYSRCDQSEDTLNAVLLNDNDQSSHFNTMLVQVMQTRRAIDKVNLLERLLDVLFEFQLVRSFARSFNLHLKSLSVPHKIRVYWNK